VGRASLSLPSNIGSAESLMGEIRASNALSHQPYSNGVYFFSNRTADGLDTQAFR
jgi:hypothetical protein